MQADEPWEAAGAEQVPGAAEALLEKSQVKVLQCKPCSAGEKTVGVVFVLST